MSFPFRLLLDPSPGIISFLGADSLPPAEMDFPRAAFLFGDDKEPRAGILLEKRSPTRWRILSVQGGGLPEEAMHYLVDALFVPLREMGAQECSVLAHGEVSFWRKLGFRGKSPADDEITELVRPLHRKRARKA